MKGLMKKRLMDDKGGPCMGAHGPSFRWTILAAAP
jgi:hypothetical protein